MKQLVRVSYWTIDKKTGYDIENMEEFTIDIDTLVVDFYRDSGNTEVWYRVSNKSHRRVYKSKQVRVVVYVIE